MPRSRVCSARSNTSDQGYSEKQNSAQAPVAVYSNVCARGTFRLKLGSGDFLPFTALKPTPQILLLRVSSFISPPLKRPQHLPAAAAAAASEGGRCLVPGTQPSTPVTISSRSARSLSGRQTGGHVEQPAPRQRMKEKPRRPLGPLKYTSHRRHLAISGTSRRRADPFVLVGSCVRPCTSIPVIWCWVALLFIFFIPCALTHGLRLELRFLLFWCVQLERVGDGRVYVLPRVALQFCATVAVDVLTGSSCFEKCKAGSGIGFRDSYSNRYNEQRDGESDRTEVNGNASYRQRSNARTNGSLKFP